MTDPALPDDANTGYDSALGNAGSGAPSRRRNASTQERLEAAEKTLDRLLDWVGRSDTKFSVVLGVDTGMLGFLATSAPARPNLAAVIIAAASALLLALSLFFVYRGLYPRTKGPSGSLAYFGSIANVEREDLKASFLDRPVEDHLDDVLDQIHRNSEIVSLKFKALRWSYRCLLLSTIFWTVALYLFGAIPAIPV